MQHRAIYGLDVVRFVAAMTVVTYHLGYKAWALRDYKLNELLGAQPLLPPWWSWTWFGWVGVQVFFVISGFVIAFSSERATPQRFVIGRVTRLAPSMWIAAVICSVVAVVEGVAPSSAFYLMLKSAVFAPFGLWIAGQIWTLPIEIFFYGFVLSTILTTSKRSGVLAWPLTTISAAFWIAAQMSDIENELSHLTGLLLLQHGCYFAIGIFLWLARRDGWSASIVSGLAICTGTAWLQIREANLWEHPGYDLESWPLVPFAIFLASLALMVASIWGNDWVHARLQARASLFRSLGVLTYPLYLVHWHVGGLAMVWLYHAGASSAAAFAGGCVASIAVAWVIVAYVEPRVARSLAAGLKRVWPSDRWNAAAPGPS